MRIEHRGKSVIVLKNFRPFLSEITKMVFFQVQGVWSTGYIPPGTRFGPLVGEVYAKDAVPNTANRKYFWRVSFF